MDYHKNSLLVQPEQTHEQTHSVVIQQVPLTVISYFIPMTPPLI